MILRLVLLLLLSPLARADAGWTGPGRVAEIGPEIGRFVFRLETGENPSDCRDKAWFYVDYTGLGAELMFHALLRSIVADKQVQVFVTGRCDLNQYSEVSTLRLHR